MRNMTYNRPYQYVEDIRLFGCYRSKEHAVFIGQGFADNAMVYIESGAMLTKLEQEGKVVRGDFDQLVTKPFEVEMPYRVYVVNPDDENGKASNAIEFSVPADNPVLDVQVNGKSVVKDQVARIDLTGKLDSIMKPNKVYGTDSDGRETQFDRSQIEGVQHIFVNGEEQPVDMGNVRIIDIAKESKSVQRVSAPLQLYGTNQDGEQATYPRDFFATATGAEESAERIKKLEDGKQDRDAQAKDGYIAIMKDGQSVGSETNLADTMEVLEKTEKDLDDLTQKVSKGLEKDWKAHTAETCIQNHPVTDNSIVITNGSLDTEKPYREDAPGSVVMAMSPGQLGGSATMVGNMVTATDYAVAVGSRTNATGTSSVALGSMANASGENATSVGRGALASAKGAVAIGSNSVADKEDTVSVGMVSSDPDIPSMYRRVTALAEPVDDCDAATKAYVDSYIKDLNGSTTEVEQVKIALPFIKNKATFTKIGDIVSVSVADDEALLPPDTNRNMIRYMLTDFKIPEGFRPREGTIGYITLVFSYESIVRLDLRPDGSIYGSGKTYVSSSSPTPGWYPVYGSGMYFVGSVAKEPQDL